MILNERAPFSNWTSRFSSLPSGSSLFVCHFIGMHVQLSTKVFESSYGSLVTSGLQQTGLVPELLVKCGGLEQEHHERSRGPIFAITHGSSVAFFPFAHELPLWVLGNLSCSYQTLAQVYPLPWSIEASVLKNPWCPSRGEGEEGNFSGSESWSYSVQLGFGFERTHYKWTGW